MPGTKWPHPRTKWKRAYHRNLATGTQAGFALDLLTHTDEIDPLTPWQRKMAVSLLTGSKPPAGSGKHAVAEAAAAAARLLRL